MSPRNVLLALALFLFCRPASAQSADAGKVDKESAAVVELGGVASWNFRSGRSSFGPTAALEVTPVEKWLELEIGVTPLFRRQSTEWSTDLLFKKPWTLTKKIEFMAGVGPEWVHSRDNGLVSNSVSGEAVLDFMFWCSAKHKFGWYLEPGYDYNFGRGHEQSLGITAGLLISIP